MSATPSPVISERSLHNLGWPAITAALADRAQSPRGKARCAALQPASDRAAIEASLRRIAEARALLTGGLEARLGDAADVSDALALAAKGAVLEAGALRACASLIRTASRIRSFFGEHRDLAPNLAALAATLPDASPLASRIESAFEPSGRIKDSASGLLESLRSRSRSLHQSIQSRLDELLDDPTHAPALRDSYVSIRNDRYVVPVQASFRSQIPGIIHNASNSGQTLFVEPEAIVSLGNDLSITESMVAEEERRILAELSVDLGNRVEELSGAIDILAELDLAWAGARLAEDLGASEPELAAPQAPFVLREARHPLLLLQGQKVVANDIRLEPTQQVLVISGPNAGGKTVSLTTVGLCALLVRAGLPIPAAPGSVVPLYLGIDCALGDEQDLERGLSTFSAHLLALRRILEEAKAGSLVLIDEIAADTDPKEGAALAAAVLEELVSRGAHAVVTTHLEELKAIGLRNPSFANANVRLDPETLTPTFRLELGSPGLSSALTIAARVGLPASVLERAEAKLHGGGALASALQSLEASRQEAEEERRALHSEREELQRAREELARSRAEVEAQRKEVEAKVRAELAGEIEQARKEVGAWIAKLTERPSVKAAVETQRRIDERLEAERRKEREARARAESREAPPLEPGRLEPGARVRIRSLGGEGEVLSLDGDEAVVQAGILKTRIPVVDLEVLPKRGRPKARPTPRPEAMAATPLQASELRCDLRGMRAEEALREMEAFLDQAFSEGHSQVLIVHGLGTGALMRAVREALAASPYVGHFRRGERHEGGDGVTVAELRT